MNPVTLKELRQLTRSRTISGAICGFFLVLLGAAALVIAANTDSKGVLSSGTGRDVFDWLAALFAPIVSLVIPGNLFARLVSEHGPGRAEPIAATALPPSRFVDGKIRSGLALAAVFLAGALPFLLCSYLLGGLDVLYVLSWTFAVAMCASVAVHLSLCLAALRLPGPVRWLAWALCAIPCVPFALLSGEGYEELPWDRWEFLAFGAAAIVSIDWLLRGVAIALLSPPSTDRARPLRLAAAALWPAWLAAVLGIGAYHGQTFVAALLFASFAGLPLLAMLAVDLSMPDGPSRRILLDRPRTRLRRLLRFPFTTGAQAGLAFAAPPLLAGAAAVLVFSRRLLDPATTIPPGSLAVDHPGAFAGFQVLFAYLLAALLLARAAMRLPPLARRGGARFTALAAVALLALAALLPNLLSIGSSFDPDLSPFNIFGIDYDDILWNKTASVWTLGENIGVHALAAAIGLLLSLLLSLRPFYRALRRYLSSASTPPTP